METQLEKLSATELGWCVNQKEIKPREVLEYFESRLNSINPQINAFTYTNFEDAYREADELESKILEGKDIGPLAGVPIALKDFLPSKKGWPATHGGVKCLHTIDDADSRFYSAAKQLGAIAVGKTNAPAFGFRGTTDNMEFGPTSTPFNTKYNSGGSSGGSAAAVGAGIVPIAEGGDAGGSIRIPAAWCNCFGYKPSAGLVPSICRPDAWTATHPYCCGGPISRTVLDAALILNQMKEYDPKDPISAPLEHCDFTTAADKSLKGVKIALTFNFNLFPLPDETICNLIADAAEVLTQSGATLLPAHFDFKHSRSEIEEAWLTGICIDTAIDMNLEQSQGQSNPWRDYIDYVPKAFIKWNMKARHSTIMDYRKFNEIRTDILDAHLKIFETCDLIISPVTGCLPVLNSDNNDTKGPNTINNQIVDPLIGFGYTYLENMIGFPAASIPAGFIDGLPVGMQIIAPRYHDYDIFTTAFEYEKLRPWKDNYINLL